MTDAEIRDATTVLLQSARDKTHVPPGLDDAPLAWAVSSVVTACESNHGLAIHLTMELCLMWAEQQHNDTDERAAFNDLLGDVDVSL